MTAEALDAPAGPRPAGSPWAGRPRVPFVPDRPDALRTDFAGGRWRLAGLAFRTAVLTVVTLGLYRFWMKTRLRRWYWSAVRPGGHPLEYTGDPVEKLLGFLIAVVVLAFYLGIVNLGLMFASLAILEDYVLPTIVTSLGLVPMIFYARYRARRYLLARTRWRGIRFGLEPGAVGYAWRAMLHWAITVLTLGILWPRMTFMLEKYRTDRTTFGDARLVQGGRWQMLMRGVVPVWVGIIFAGSGGVGLVLAGSSRGPATELWVLLIVVGLLMATIGMVHYSVRSFRLLAGTKRLETGSGAVGLAAAPRTSRVLGIYLLGYALTFAALGFLLMGFGGVAFAIIGASGIDPMRGVDPLATISDPAIIALSMAGYFALFLAWGVLRQALVTLPLLRHYALTLSVAGVSALPGVRQAARDEATEAGGFAEALDLGAAI